MRIQLLEAVPLSDLVPGDTFKTEDGDCFIVTNYTGTIEGSDCVYCVHLSGTLKAFAEMDEVWPIKLEAVEIR